MKNSYLVIIYLNKIKFLNIWQIVYNFLKYEEFILCLNYFNLNLIFLKIKMILNNLI